MKHLQNIICFSAENQQRHQLAPERCHCPLSVCFVWLFPAGWHGRGDARGATLCTPRRGSATGTNTRGSRSKRFLAREFWVQQELASESQRWGEQSVLNGHKITWNCRTAVSLHCPMLCLYSALPTVITWRFACVSQRLNVITQSLLSSWHFSSSSFYP